MTDTRLSRSYPQRELDAVLAVVRAWLEVPDGFALTTSEAEMKRLGQEWALREVKIKSDMRKAVRALDAALKGN